MRAVAKATAAILLFQLALYAASAEAVPISENQFDGVNLQIRNYTLTTEHSIFICEVGAASCDKNSVLFSDIIVLFNDNNAAKIVFASDAPFQEGNRGLISGTPMTAPDPSFFMEQDGNPVFFKTYDATDSEGNKGTLTISFSSDPDPDPRPINLPSDTIEVVANQAPAADVAIVPEPSTLLLAGIGFAAALLMNTASRLLKCKRSESTGS
jgi:hypothetical protein